MSLLFNIVYAAHANGTHHKLALDALKSLSVDEGEKWVKLFLKHSEIYMQGSKEPDKVFKDFKNHVLHVQDNYWGGAEDKCREWYDEFVRRMVEEKWEDAVYAAGVLSHYYTDPIMPFHTAQSEAESAIHRAVEWTINKSYNELRKQGERDFPLMMVLPPDEGVDFAAKMVRQGAEASNKYYSHLIAHYNFDRGAVEPTEGYNALGRDIVAELLIYAARGFALVLDEAIKTSGAQAPDVNLTAETFVAGLKIPLKWVTRKMDDMAEKKLVQSMYDELQTTGKVEETLAEDDRFIKQAHRKEVLGVVEDENESDSQGELALEPEAEMTPSEKILAEAEAAEAGEAESHDEQERRDGEARLPEKRVDRGPSFYLSLGDNVEDGPSIGVKTAKRLDAVGIKTVNDLLQADAEATANALDVRYITAKVVIEWQDQARLQCEIPRLRGHDAQFLVGCGYRDKQSVIEADPETVLVDLQAFLLTSAGERLLRPGNEPDLQEVKSWIESAKLTLEADAA